MKVTWIVARILPLVVVVAAIGAVAWYVVPRLDGDDEADVPEPVSIEEWPAELRPFVRFVEEERDLRFTKVVDVEMLPEKEFVAAATDDEELTEEDREDIEKSEGLFKALGLVASDVDLYAQSQALQGSGTVGFYSFDDRKIRVRGSELTPATRSTLVHELTHALQDQRFDVSDRFEDLQEQDDDGGAASAFRALVEGDAERVETAWAEQLGAKEKAALAKEQAAAGQEFTQQSKGIPPVLVALVGAPYAIGQAMTDLAVELDGTDAVDDLFEDPPTTEEQILDPWLLLHDAGRLEPLDVDVPPTGAGEEQVDEGTFGAFGWYVVLAQRVDVRTALAAADGWGGDAYSAFEREGRSCVRVAYRGDTRRDVDQLATALEEWIEDSPDSALVQRTRAGLVFTSCESGRVPPSGDAEEIIALPAVRTTVATTVLRQGVPEDFARCYSSGAVREFTLEELNGTGDAAEFRALAERCR